MPQILRMQINYMHLEYSGFAEFALFLLCITKY